MRILSILPVLFLLITGQANAQSSEVDVDAEVEKLLETIGGREIWRDATGFIMDEILYTDARPLPVIRKYWVDFKSPRIMESAIVSGLEQRQALNGGKGWTLRNGELSNWDDATVSGWQAFWPGIPTRIFHLLAADDPSLSYKWRDGVIDFFVDGKRVVWIGASEQGTPVAYGRDDRHSITHFLGKSLAYGDVTLWSEATEPGGNWRVVMVDYELLTEPHKISFEPPSE